MRKLLIGGGVGIVAVAVAFQFGLLGRGAASGGAPEASGAAFARPPMAVDVGRAARRDLAEHLTIVGNLIGATTVEIVPKVSGRLRSVPVRLGDAVSQGQVIAQIEDNEIREQVKQAEASFEVSRATIRQREADLKFAETSLERSKNLYGRNLLPKQTLDDSEARHQAALAQLDLARAQFTQASSRIEELRITLGNTTITSPVDGFVGRRLLDPGAFVSSNSPVLSVVDIHLVRLVVNLIEKDLRRVAPGAVGRVEVDAFPGDVFDGRVARIAPVLDPATRTAEMEIEIDNPAYRLKPGMYARVQLTVARRSGALTVPRNAVVDIEGRRGVFVPVAGDSSPAAAPAAATGSAAGRKARFIPVETGLQDGELVEILKGLADGDAIVTAGAAALRDGDTILLPVERRSDGAKGSASAGGAPPAP